MREAKVTGYCQEDLSLFMDREEVDGHKQTKTERGRYPTIPIKEKKNEKMIFG